MWWEKNYFFSQHKHSTVNKCKPKHVDSEENPIWVNGASSIKSIITKIGLPDLLLDNEYLGNTTCYLLTIFIAFSSSYQHKLSSRKSNFIQGGTNIFSSHKYVLLGQLEYLAKMPPFRPAYWRENHQWRWNLSRYLMSRIAFKSVLFQHCKEYGVHFLSLL